jgi:DNA-binding MarR family transcriptional regulator
MTSMTKARREAREAEVLMSASKVISAAVAHSLAAGGDTVSAPGLRVLVMLESAGSLNLSAVAEGLGVNASTASRTCDRLVVDGLVDREERADDRRQVALSLTARGTRFLDRVMAERKAVLLGVVESMSREDREALVTGLAGFVRAAAMRADDGPSGGHGAIIRWLL